MQKAGYVIEEDTSDPDLRAIFGRRDLNSLSVVVSDQGDKTLVQIAYVLY
jgi:hypothetical protein